jgi:hypothetical protein
MSEVIVILLPPAICLLLTVAACAIWEKGYRDCEELMRRVYDLPPKAKKKGKKV